jgi:hypothetical protein
MFVELLHTIGWAMSIQTLLRSQRNECFRIVQEKRLNVADFEWTEYKHKPDDNVPRLVTAYPRPTSYTYSKLVHSISRHYFDFCGDSPKWSPDEFRFEGSAQVSAVRESERWKEKLRYFDRWAGFLAREVLTPDLWEAVRTGGELPGLSGDARLSNAPFTPKEQTYLAQQLKEIHQFVERTEQLQDDQKRFLEERFAYFEESSKRLGRKDWLNLLMGALLNTVINLAIPPDKINEIFHFTSTALSQLFSVRLSLPL